MSAFSFTDEPVSNDGGGEDSAFSFFSEPQDQAEDNASDFTFGSSSEPDPAPVAAAAAQPAAAQQKKAPPPKKGGSRVIGMQKGKKAAGKKPAMKKFAKKEEGAKPGGMFAKAAPKKPEPAKVEVAPPPPAPVEEPSAFSFGGDAEPEPEAEEGAFNFGAAEPEPAQQEPVVQQEPEPMVQHPVKAHPEPAKKGDMFGSLKTVRDEDIPEAPSDLSEPCRQFVTNMARQQVSVEKSQTLLDKTHNSLKDMEVRQADALMNEQFDVAEQLNSQISRARTTVLKSQQAITTAMMEAMNLANQAPGHLLTHAEESQKELPDLKTRKSALDKRLATLMEDQTADKETIEIERKKNANTLDELKRPIDEHEESHQAMIMALEEQLKAKKLPFEQQISELQAEKDSHNQTIAELLAKVEEHRKIIATLDKEMSKQHQNIKEADQSFNPQRHEIAEDQKALDQEKAEFQKRVREIEAPFQSLVDTVEKRETEITGVTAAVDKVNQQIEDGEKDAKECQGAATIIEKLCQEHSTYAREREAVKTRFDTAEKKATDGENRRNEINTETIELRSQSQRASEFLIDAKSKLPQLEASKKAAVASKNFRGAQQINKQITTITEQVQKNEAIVADTTQRLENLEGEATTLSDEIARSQVEAEESKIQLLQLDHDFFQSAVTELQSLFSISPFGERLLSPLFKMFEFALAHTEVPKQLSKEELEAELARLKDELNNAVEIEDFDTATSLNEKITTIEAKLEKMEKAGQ